MTSYRGYDATEATMTGIDLKLDLQVTFWSEYDGVRISATADRSGDETNASLRARAWELFVQEIDGFDGGAL